jgi:hypothetical protein
MEFEICWTLMVAELYDFESFGLIFQDGILTVENTGVGK